MNLSAKLSLLYEILWREWGPQGWWPGDSFLEICIGAILTQNTSWKNVEKALKVLKEKRLLNLDSLNKISTNKLASFIKSAGYYNIKAERLKNFIQWLDDKVKQERSIERLSQNFSGDKLRKELLNIKGIGEETADSILLYAFNKKIFVVDAYTRRIFYRVGIISSYTLKYSEIQRIVHINFPGTTQIYNEFHALLVKLGKTFCKKKLPLCGECPINKEEKIKCQNFLH